MNYFMSVGHFYGKNKQPTGKGRDYAQGGTGEATPSVLYAM
jgi:hypothetical protein